jgi:hypothetical protein
VEGFITLFVILPRIRIFDYFTLELPYKTSFFIHFLTAIIKNFEKLLLERIITNKVTNTFQIMNEEKLRIIITNITYPNSYTVC